MLDLACCLAPTHSSGALHGSPRQLNIKDYYVPYIIIFGPSICFIKVFISIMLIY
jgi:hypothetical protein